MAAIGLPPPAEEGDDQMLENILTQFTDLGAPWLVAAAAIWIAYKIGMALIASYNNRISEGDKTAREVVGALSGNTVALNAITSRSEAIEDRMERLEAKVETLIQRQGPRS